MLLQLCAWGVLGAASLFMGQPLSALFGAGLIWVLIGVPAASALAWFVIERAQRSHVGAPLPVAQHELIEVVATLKGMASEMAAMLAGTDNARASGGTLLEVGAWGELINIEDGRVVKVVTANALELLPNEQREHLHKHAASLSETQTKWAKLYAKRNRFPFAFMQRRLDQRLRQLAAGTREHLDGVVAILQSLGIKPDDHYLQLRGLALAATGEGERA
jgi:hypothetical protein